MAEPGKTGVFSLLPKVVPLHQRQIPQGLTSFPLPLRQNTWCCCWVQEVVVVACAAAGGREEEGVEDTRQRWDGGSRNTIDERRARVPNSFIHNKKNNSYYLHCCFIVSSEVYQLHMTPKDLLGMSIIALKTIKVELSELIDDRMKEGIDVFDT